MSLRRAARRVASVGLPLLLSAPLAAQAQPVPPPAEQRTADCRAPVFATDQLVCADPGLRALDSELAALLAQVQPPASRWAEPQQAWFQRRSRCAFAEDHRDCAEAAYRERLALLHPLGEASRRRASRCDKPDILAIVVSEDRIVLVDKAGSVQGAVSSMAVGSSWTPFLTTGRRNGALTLRTAAGDTLRCRIGVDAKPG